MSVCLCVCLNVYIMKVGVCVEGGGGEGCLRGGGGGGGGYRGFYAEATSKVITFLDIHIFTIPLD